MHTMIKKKFKQNYIDAVFTPWYIDDFPKVSFNSYIVS